MLEGFKSLFSKEILYLPLYSYGLVKLILPINTNTFLLLKLVLPFLRPILSIITCLILLFSLSLCATFFEISKLLAQCKYKNRYFDYLHGADAVWSFDEKPGNSIITSFHIFQNDGPETMDKLIPKAKKYLQHALQYNPRLLCTREAFLGYFYLVKKEDICIDDIIHPMEPYKDTKEFNKILNKIISSPLPCDNKFMWEINYGKQLIELEEGKQGYPLVIRAHHSCMDGLSLTIFMVSWWVENSYDVLKDIFDNMRSRLKVVESKKKREKTFLGVAIATIAKLKELWNQGIYFHHDVLFHKEMHRLHPGEVGIGKLFAMSLEPPKGDFMKKIRFSKKMLNVSYADVVLGAVAASFTEYFQKSEKHLQPKFITIVNTFLRELRDFNDIVRIQDGEVVSTVGNKFSAGIIKLPINRKFLKEPLEFVYEVHKQANSLKKALDCGFLDLVFNVICTIVPKCISARVMNKFDCASISTNLPGINEMKLKSGHRVIDTAAWTLQWQNIGMSFLLYTFNNRLRFCIFIDKNYVDGEQEAQDICDNFFKYVDVIYESVLNRN